jgi:hypothetical protein
MKKKEKKENLKIDLFSFEREKISAQAMGNLLGGSLCKCLGQSGQYPLDGGTVLTIR